MTPTIKVKLMSPAAWNTAFLLPQGHKQRAGPVRAGSRKEGTAEPPSRRSHCPKAEIKAKSSLGAQKVGTGTSTTFPTKKSNFRRVSVSQTPSVQGLWSKFTLNVQVVSKT